MTRARRGAAVVVYTAGAVIAAGTVGAAVRGPYARGAAYDMAVGAAVLGGVVAVQWAARELGRPA